MRGIVLLCLLAAHALASEITGYISDAPCGWNNGKEAKECAQKCVRAGWDPVFVPDGQMNAYRISGKRLASPQKAR